MDWTLNECARASIPTKADYSFPIIPIHRTRKEFKNFSRAFGEPKLKYISIEQNRNLKISAEPSASLS